MKKMINKTLTAIMTSRRRMNRPGMMISHHRRMMMIAASIVSALFAMFGRALQFRQNRQQQQQGSIILMKESKQLTTTTSPDVTYPFQYPNDGFPTGIRSHVSLARLRTLQQEVDEQDPSERCRRYGYYYNSSFPKQRRIFYGANIANEPWEIFEIVAAEAYGILEGMVFIEANRTHNFEPRPFQRLKHGPIVQRLFGANQVRVLQYVDENPHLRELDRDMAQRNHILQGWKDMGMTPEDVAYHADTDETFSRDFLRAVQVCDGIDSLDYESHHCGHGKSHKVSSKSRVFEMSPDCISDGYNWRHPDMVLGACVELIGNDIRPPQVMMEGVMITKKLWRINNMRNSWDADQMGTQPHVHDSNYDNITGYHFHNFFTDLNATRFKYFSYAHPDRDAMRKRLQELHGDMGMGVRCVQHIPDDPESELKRTPGGFESLARNLPLYFMDADYRRRRMHHLQTQIELDDNAILAGRQTTN